MTKLEVQEKLQEVVNRIVKEYQPEKIILFGSFAWGEPDPDSDIDLLIVKETKNTREAARKISRLIFPRPFPMDILVYAPDEVERKIKEERNLFIEDIVNNGRILYERQ
jgi:predicted nucleotidyltransferase